MEEGRLFGASLGRGHFYTCSFPNFTFFLLVVVLATMSKALVQRYANVTPFGCCRGHSRQRELIRRFAMQIYAAALNVSPAPAITAQAVEELIFKDISLESLKGQWYAFLALLSASGAK